jgi:hypothetical protein
MFCAPGLIFGGTEGVRYLFHVCAVGLIFGGTEGVASRFQVFHSRTHFRRYRGRPVPFSCFAHPDSFSEVSRASAPVFMLCTPGLVFDGTEGVGSYLHVLRSRTHFRGYRGRPVPFSFFALLDMFFAVPRVSGPVLMFCSPRVVSCGTEGVGYRFQVLRARTHFRRYRGRQVPFSSFALRVSFSTVPLASGPVFIFCAPRLIFDGPEGVGSYFHVLLARTRFR